MYSIIDVETTGGSPRFEKITDIAIYVHDGHKIVDEFTSLVNPEKPIPAFISSLTGITNDMVAEAPRFCDIARRIVEMTDNTIFVAHNSSFDYGFVRSEFQSLGYDFRRATLCTVKLSRKMIPGHKSYSLGNLCSELGITIEDRHRASGDAKATVKLFEHLLSLSSDHKITTEFDDLKGLNAKFNRLLLDRLPEECGVYYLHDEAGNIIYIGKSRNIKNRVLSHLNGTSTRKAIEMKSRIADVTYEITGSELIALLKESEEIKLQKPLYNRAQRRAIFTYGLYSFIDENGYLQLQIAKNTDFDETPILSYHNKQEASKHLLGLIEQHQLCQQLCGLYHSEHGCFQYNVGSCKGACVGEEPPASYNARVQAALRPYEFDHKSFVVIDKGRTTIEKSLVCVENGKYMGFGFLDPDRSYTNSEDIKYCINRFADNRDVQQIIRTYLNKHKVEKIIPY
jgi:DNA polymerase III subunit epsilon